MPFIHYKLALLLDWNQASEQQRIDYSERYFPAIPQKGDAAMQIVSSGPDTEWEVIKNGYLKIIIMQKNIFIFNPLILFQMIAF